MNDNISPECSILVERVDELKGLILEQIRDQAGRGDDTSWLTALAKAAERLDEHKRAIQDFEKDYWEFSRNILGWESGSETRNERKLRQIQIELTQGMIRQNLLSLTTARKRGFVRLGEKFKVTLPDGREFETDLCEPGNKFRERGAIREFYGQINAKDGDVILLRELQPGCWSLAKQNGQS
jgi:hypothetical protein